jgi:hypothetical protein
VRTLFVFGLALSFALGARAQQGDPCAALSELACARSSACKLVQAQPERRGGYVCRSNANRCEDGFVQRGDRNKETCEARSGCAFRFPDCYCPPDLNCRCGGGRPAMCVPS